LKQPEDSALGLDAPGIEDTERFLRHLSACTRNLRFYPQGHEILKRSVQSVYDSAMTLMNGRSKLSLGLLDDEWIVNNSVLHKAGSLASDLKERLRARNLTSITLTSALTLKDIEGLADLLTRDPESVNQVGATSILRELGATGITVGFLAKSSHQAARVEATPEDETPLKDLAIPDFLCISAKVISDLYSEAVEGKIDLGRAKSMLSDIMDIVSPGRSNLGAMLGIKSHDDYTFTHIVNVCVLTLGQARSLDLSEEVLDDIGLAALMHDVGKKRVPGDIIRKPSGLTDEEYELMKMHTIYGAEMLQEMPGAPPLAGMVAFEHHLRFDCQGYPEVHRRRQLNLCTYLTTIADAFDAMSTLRPYSKKMSQEEVAIRMANDSGTQFEPILLSRFFRMLNIFPKGSEVLLSTGEKAVVLEQRPEDCMRPKVRLTTDSEGNAVEGGRTVDLMKTRGSNHVYIRGVPRPDGDEEGGAEAA
jgi:HD-GYP domain-containing protein (c-di-GMP phosphodiesterase class II)